MTAQKTRFAESDLENLYALAVSQYQQGRHEKALDIFTLLLASTPLEERYLLGAGACLQQSGRFREALPAYLAAYYANPDNIHTVLHFCECLVRLGYVREAATHLEGILDLNWPAAATPALERARGLLALLHATAAGTH